MDRFHVADDAAVILRSRGVYRQAKVYPRAGAVYASAGAGFIRLYKGGGTSTPNISWDDIDLNGAGADSLVADAHGRLSYNGPLKQIEGVSK